jgi:hypothetical protein
MPFRHAAFEPGDLIVLTAAFDAAWQQVIADDLDSKDENQIGELRRHLAKCIVAVATPGNLDLSKLTEDAVTLFNGKGK